MVVVVQLDAGPFLQDLKRVGDSEAVAAGAGWRKMFEGRLLVQDKLATFRQARVPRKQTDRTAESAMGGHVAYANAWSDMARWRLVCLRH